MARGLGSLMKAGKWLIPTSDGVEAEVFRKEIHLENGAWTRETRLYLKLGGRENGSRPLGDCDYIAHEDGTIDWEVNEDRKEGST